MNSIIKPLFFLLSVITIIYSNPIFGLLLQDKPVYIYTNNSPHSTDVLAIFNKFNIRYEIVDCVSINNNALYIVFDVHTIAKENLPTYYIVFQTLNLSNISLTSDYLNKLSKAVAVWDNSLENISHYKSLIPHNRYISQNYEYIDPIILPCYLPISALNSYKDLLQYENIKNTDISSHLPTLFVYGVMQQPKLILEVGVAGGESTKALRKTAEFSGAYLLGLDINSYSQGVYINIPNSTFICMDDCDFVNSYYLKSNFKDKKIDIIFIDTSHLYEHTMREIEQFLPLLSENGFISFHDSNVTPYNNNDTYFCLNGTVLSANGNTRGVTRALKEYFSLDFDEYRYCNIIFTKSGITWHMIHYPFCNGLTIIQKMKSLQ